MLIFDEREKGKVCKNCIFFQMTGIRKNVKKFFLHCKKFFKRFSRTYKNITLSDEYKISLTVSLKSRGSWGIGVKIKRERYSKVIED